MAYDAHFRLWAAYAGIASVFALIPGPAVLFVVSQGVWRGPAAAMRANAAINLVNMTYLALSGLGLAALLGLSQMAFTVIKLVGAVYLVWLGVKAIRSSLRPHDESLSARPGRPFIDGLVVQGSNPKVFLFLGAILPQFLTHTEPLVPQLIALGLIGLVTETTSLTGYGLLAGLVRRKANLPAARAWLERIGGVILIGIAIATALYRRS